MSKIWIFDSIENNCDVCKGEDCMKNFCKPLTLFRIDFFGLLTDGVRPNGLPSLKSATYIPQL